MGGKPRTSARPDPSVGDLPAEEREEVIDEAVDESFPASDPPAYGGSVRVGGPERPEEPRGGRDH